MNNFQNLQVYDAQGDLSKSWFISYYFKYPHTGTFKRFREISDINRIDSISDRREALFALKHAKEAMLSGGWSPFQQYDPEKFLEDAGITS